MDASGHPVAQTLVQSSRSFCATERVCEWKRERGRCRLPVCPCLWHLWLQQRAICIDLLRKSGIWVVTLPTYCWGDQPHTHVCKCMVCTQYNVDNCICSHFYGKTLTKTNILLYPCDFERSSFFCSYRFWETIMDLQFRACSQRWSLVFRLLWFQKARTMPLSEYYLLHSSAHYTDSQVKNNSLFTTMEQTLNVRLLCLLNYNLQLTTRDCINTLPTWSHKNHLHIKQIIELNNL